LRSSITQLTSAKAQADIRPQGAGGFFRFCTVGLTMVAMLIGGCSHIDEGALSQEASQFFNQGDYAAALSRYEQLLDNDPDAVDRILFEMGITYAYPTNPQKDYQKALNCFQKIVGDYPESEYRLDSQMMILQIHNATLKDETIAAQQAALDTSRQALEDKADEIDKLQDTIATLEEKLFALRAEAVDKVLIEKQTRRLTLLAKGEVLKTYTIALGGNPVGPKEQQGDCKTPEGTYIIDSRNGNSGYHLSLHISYPNEEDKRRARELGVPPGGDIMIHGIKNGFAKLGAAHAERDWTEGCIAVTDQEMEEIYRFVPNGTVVEITP
jgi:L,D-peptidoglycan transpeptidase YkuD (ErfK/YbiS/YcfS/YnhG family)